MSEGETAAAATGRPLQLSILLLVLLAMNAFGFAKGLATRDQLLREIPSLTPTMFTVWLASSLVAIAGVFGLWNLRRWGLYLIGLSWATVVVLDLMVGATWHVLLATGVMWLVVLFVRPVRAALK